MRAAVYPGVPNYAPPYEPFRENKPKANPCVFRAFCVLHACFSLSHHACTCAFVSISRICRRHRDGADGLNGYSGACLITGDAKSAVKNPNCKKMDYPQIEEVCINGNANNIY